MPLYSMKNLDTDEIYEISLTMSEREKYLEENKNVIQVFTKAPSIGDSVRLGIKKPDRAFDDVLKKAKDAHKHSTVRLNH